MNLNRKEMNTDFMSDRSQDFKNEVDAVLDDADIIRTILEEADRGGLRAEVEMWAEKFWKEDRHINVVTAYQLAFDEWLLK